MWKHTIGDSHKDKEVPATPTIAGYSEYTSNMIQMGHSKIVLAFVGYQGKR